MKIPEQYKMPLTAAVIVVALVITWKMFSQKSDAGKLERGQAKLTRAEAASTRADSKAQVRLNRSQRKNCKQECRGFFLRPKKHRECISACMQTGGEA